MIDTRAKRKPSVSICHFCEKRIYSPPRESAGWARGDLWGIKRMVQFHHECYFRALDELQDSKEAEAKA